MRYYFTPINAFLYMNLISIIFKSISLSTVVMKEWKPHIESIKGDIHRYFLREAYSYAWENSPDLSTKAGALIVGASLDEVIAYGTNRFPEGLTPTDAQIGDRQWKYEHIIHAEHSAIFSAAAKGGKPTEGAVMYMPWVPCTPCAKAIISAGIKTLISHRELVMKTPERWWTNTNYALDLLELCGVKKFMYEGKIGDVKGLFDGSQWYP